MSVIQRDMSGAIRMIRDILAERSRTYQELIDASLVLHPFPEGYQPTRSTLASSSRLTTKPSIRSPNQDRGPTSLKDARAKSTPQQTQLSVKDLHSKPTPSSEFPDRERLPPGHPFVSSSYLKRHILPALQRQGLVFKEPWRAVHLVHKPHSSGSSFHWHIAGPRHYRATRPAQRSWSVEEHWQRLVDGEPVSQLQHEVAQAEKARENELREQALASGKIERTEREIWAWEGRDPEMTTRLQRLHLSRRKQKNRDQKEAKQLKFRSASEIGKLWTESVEAREQRMKGKRLEKKKLAEEEALAEANEEDVEDVQGKEREVITPA